MAGVRCSSACRFGRVAIYQTTRPRKRPCGYGGASGETSNQLIEEMQKIGAMFYFYEKDKLEMEKFREQSLTFQI
jgi:hypothetical protein